MVELWLGWGFDNKHTKLSETEKYHWGGGGHCTFHLREKTQCDKPDKF